MDGTRPSLNNITASSPTTVIRLTSNRRAIDMTLSPLSRAV